MSLEKTILSPLYTAVSWIVVQFHSFYSLFFPASSGWAWGLAIVSLVVLIRTALIPLFVKQIKSTRNMQALQPKMKAIQERYKNDKQRQSEEMMRLYKESGTNPLSSCLPIIVQAPFFMSLYGVLSSIAGGHTVGVINGTLLSSARHARIFGAPLSVKFTDSASKIAALGASATMVHVVIIVMIVLMSASQFYTQRQLMTKNIDTSVKTPFMQQQKMLMYGYPVIFAVFGINFPVGVLVYWLTSNAWTMGQQLVVIRRNPTPGSVAYKQRQERLRAKGELAADSPAMGKAAVEDPQAPQPVKRQQPKRQSKAQRHHAGATGGPESASASPAAPVNADERVREPRNGKPSVSAAKTGATKTTTASTGQPSGKGAQRKGQQSPKHPSKK